MTKRSRRLGALLGILAGTVAGAARAEENDVIEPEPVVACDWCDLLKTPGKPIYENEDSWFINSFRFMGRFQFQAAYLDGDDVDGDDFSEDFTDFRRVRFGAQAKFLRYFQVKAGANWVADRRQIERRTDWAYQSFDVLFGSFDAGEALGLEAVDDLSFHYGRRKMLVGREVHESSKRIKTVERSAIANRAFPIRMTGGWIDASKGSWSGTAGIFTTDSSQEIADWKGGEAYYLNLNRELANGDALTFDFLYNDANGDSDNRIVTNQGEALYEWVFSAAWDGRRGKWGLMANAILGDNGDADDSDREGMFYGLVLLPTYDLTEKFELVGRYAFQFSAQDEGIRTNGRYFRREIRTGADVNGGRGDSHHSLYGGLNYYLCGDNMKIMTAVEWETLDTPDGDADAWTLWLAYRFYF